ncbi:MAG TPA: hypothetical protein VFZ23_17670 [Pyrinomonadaceae bacterium]
MRLLLLRVPGYLFAVLALVLIAAPASPTQPLAVSAFEEFVSKRYAKTNPAWNFQQFCPVLTSLVAERVMREYGSMFAAGESITLPDVCIFGGEAETLRYQKKLITESLEIDGVPITLQSAAAQALRKSIDEAAQKQLRITPYDGAIAGSRTYGDTLRLWNGRFFSAMDHWTRRGRLTEADRESVSRLDLHRRIEKIINWEAQGIWFSTDRTRSIFSSVAPPGSSQHLAFIAFDVVEYGDPDVRTILNRNGWYQTVAGDPVHFTFLEVPETELPGRGLRAVVKGGHFYWIPNLSPPMH